MKRRAAVVAAAAAFIVLTVCTPVTATANEQDEITDYEHIAELATSLAGTDVDVALASLTEEEVASIALYGQVADVDVTTEVHAAGVETKGTVSPQAVGCWTVTQTYWGRNVFGNDLYRTWHTGRWCSGGSSITSASTSGQGVQTYWLGWSSNGLVQSQAAVVSNQGRSFSQHSLQYQLGSPWPTQYTQPCNRVAGLTTGSYNGSYACTLY